MSERRSFNLVLSEDDLDAILSEWETRPEAAHSLLLCAWASAVLGNLGPGTFPQEPAHYDLVAPVVESGGIRQIAFGRIVPVTVFELPPVEPPPARPAPEPIPLRPAPPQRVTGLPKQYPQNIVGQIIHAAGVQIDPLVPLYWHRKEHQLEAVDLVNRSGLSSDDLVARIKAARDRPDLRRISQLADLIGGRRG
jgi:hypothetical protein